MIALNTVALATGVPILTMSHDTACCHVWLFKTPILFSHFEYEIETYNIENIENSAFWV